LDGILLGYASHSRAYRVLNLETNRIVETCEITFNETIPCTTSAFEFAGEQEMGQSIFEEEEENADDGDEDEDGIDHVPAATPVHSTLTTFVDGPDTTSTTPGHQHEPPHDQVEEVQEDPAEVEGKATSKHVTPRYIHRRHPPQQMIGNLNERTTRHKSKEISHFAHSAFVASFEPRDVGHSLFDYILHEELENIERNRVWVLVEPPPNCHPIGTKWVFKNKQSEDGLVVRNKARLVA
jgi:hypothetical protein